VEERKRLSGFLNERLRDVESHPGSRLGVAIGAESGLRELRDLSMVSCSYRAGERAAGMIGIIGPKYMEYSRMISLVNFMGEVVEKTIDHWEKMLAPGSGVIPLDFKASGSETSGGEGEQAPARPKKPQRAAKGRKRSGGTEAK
jgi:hypothetical protein